MYVEMQPSLGWSMAVMVLGSVSRMYVEMQPSLAWSMAVSTCYAYNVALTKRLLLSGIVSWLVLNLLSNHSFNFDLTLVSSFSI